MHALLEETSAPAAQALPTRAHVAAPTTIAPAAKVRRDAQRAETEASDNPKSDATAEVAEDPAAGPKTNPAEEPAAAPAVEPLAKTSAGQGTDSALLEGAHTLRVARWPWLVGALALALALGGVLLRDTLRPTTEAASQTSPPGEVPPPAPVLGGADVITSDTINDLHPSPGRDAAQDHVERNVDAREEQDLTRELSTPEATNTSHARENTAPSHKPMPMKGLKALRNVQRRPKKMAKPEETPVPRVEPTDEAAIKRALEDGLK